MMVITTEIASRCPSSTSSGSSDSKGVPPAWVLQLLKGSFTLCFLLFQEYLYFAHVQVRVTVITTED